MPTAVHSACFDEKCSRNVRQLASCRAADAVVLSLATKESSSLTTGRTNCRAIHAQRFSPCHPCGTTFASIPYMSGPPTRPASGLSTIARRGRKPMRILGILLVFLGIVALAVPSITFFTTERAVDAGFFTIDYQKP